MGQDDISGSELLTLSERLIVELEIRCSVCNGLRVAFSAHAEVHGGVILIDPICECCTAKRWKLAT